MQTFAKRAWMALHRIPELSDSLLRRLITAHHDPLSIFSLCRDQLVALGLPPDLVQVLTSCKKIIDAGGDRQMTQDWRLLDSIEINIVPLCSEHYPELLKQLNDPPPLLYVRGDVLLLNKPQLAIVGSRKPSRQGCENAFQFSKQLAAAGFTITSGLALGIDAHCHRGALAATGETIAVLGTGIDRIYPKSNHSLFTEILKQGAIISEFYPGSGPRQHHFPQRNRVISGMSLGVLVVEAALKSGSLISARCALEQNREVFAIPGSIHSPVSKGCHMLIREGARLVDTVADIMEELVGWVQLPMDNSQGIHHCSALPIVPLEPTERELLDTIGYDPISIDALQVRCAWPAAMLNAGLTALELKGLIDNRSGFVQRIS